jgi:hypothetical protein
MTEEFFDSLVNLEDAMQKEQLVETKVHEVLETVMLVQEIIEEPIIQIQEISQDMEITYKLKKGRIRRIVHEEQCYKIRNQKISEVLNTGEQCII